MKPIFLITIFSIAFEVSAQQETLRKIHFNLENTLAINGYDPVSYFKSNRARTGNKEFTFVYGGVTYYFESFRNKALFEKDPGKYEPQYGGWCAYAMGATGEKVDVNPETFKIVDEKLYLFYNRFLNNTLTDWNRNEVKLKDQADGNWLRIYK